MHIATPVLLLILITQVRCQQSCPQNCAVNRCYDSNTCTECVNGFYNGHLYDDSKHLKKNDCSYQCKSQCEACSSYLNCTKCKAGYCNKGGRRSCQDQCSYEKRCQTCSSCEVCTKCNQWYYGRNCSLICGHGCLKGICDIYSGKCNCRQNFVGVKCDQCALGKYGERCGNDCAKGCKENNCNKNNGNCTYGCKIGYKNPPCDTCLDGFYGDKCEECPRNCLNCKSAEICSVCKKGFWGIKCNGSCPQNCKTCVSESRCYNCVAGFYGMNCSFKCPKNCLDNICRQENGKCSVCKFGFWGKHCDTSCNLGCSQNNCYHQNGTCFGCKQRFTGLKCESCVDGFYGQECKHCPSNCAVCISESQCTRCIEGFHGYTCSLSCSNNCDKRKCEKDNGACLSCKDGFHGEQCDITCPEKCATNECGRDGKCYACENGYFGDTCDDPCPHHCKEKCVLNTGHCRSCIDGFFGIQCEKQCLVNCLRCSSKTNCTACKVGHKGKFCEQICSNCKNGTGCRQSDGYCLEACADGLYGNNCDEKCSPQCKTCTHNFHVRCSSCARGKYGAHTSDDGKYLRCQFNCSDACLNKTCDEISGQCTHGCQKGFWGTKCKLPCPEKCKNKNCSLNNGICLEGCEKGFYGHDCIGRCENKDTACAECVAKVYNQYGGCISCKNGHFPTYILSDTIKHKICKHCPSECVNNDCNSTDGFCLHGCIKGRWGMTCENFCSSNCLECNQGNGECLNCINGTYGLNCSQNCSSNCSASCEKDSGECVTGCSKSSRHGRYCDKECSPSCLNQECNWETGMCSSGCLQGYFGSMCDIPCSKNCMNNSCNWLNGDCSAGCSGGFEGFQCSQEAVERRNIVLLASIGAGTLVAIILGIVMIVVCIRHRKSKRAKSEIEMAEMDQNRNSENVVDDFEDDRNIGHIENTNPGCIYAKPHKPSRKQLPKSKTEPETSVTSDKRERTQACLKDEARGAEYANIENKLATLDDNKEEEYFSDDEESNKTIAIQDDGDTYYNTAAVLKRRIQLDKLKEFVSSKSREDFITEFKQLPVGLIKSYDVSQKTENRTKNRYRGVFPYDAKRVVIKSGASNYINATYIDGFMKRKAYIASMGPTTQHMGEDFAIFWEMIWQENINKIIMLTNLVESGTPKCDKYWPDKRSRCTYGSVMVKCQKEDVSKNFTIRTFTVENENYKKEKRTLYHMHFTSWPDKGIPKSVSLLTEFHKQANDESFSVASDVPVLIHCSAGVGRTGTYIALDMLTNEGRSEGYVDIFACVRNLREERVNMVQTVEQYIYLHNCIVEMLTEQQTTKTKGGNNANN